MKKGSKYSSYIKKGLSVAQTAGKALKIAEEVAGMLNTEQKILEEIVTPTFSQSGQLTAVSIPAIGTGSAGRIGDQFRMKSFHMTGVLTINASATYTLARVILLREDCPGTTALTVANVLHDIGGATLGTSKAPLLYYERDGRHRFKILFDKTYLLKDVENNAVKINFHKYWKKGPIVEFDSGSATVVQNKFYYLVITDEATNIPAAEWITRYHYVDN